MKGKLITFCRNSLDTAGETNGNNDYKFVKYILYILFGTLQFSTFPVEICSLPKDLQVVY